MIAVLQPAMLPPTMPTRLPATVTCGIYLVRFRLDQRRFGARAGVEPGELEAI
jgi:hypothetical protein